MKTINLTDDEVNRLIELANENNSLNELENWTITDLDNFREIGSEFINILQKYLKK